MEININDNILETAFEKALMGKVESDVKWNIEFPKTDLTDDYLKAVKKIDHEKLQNLITEKLEETIAEKIVNKLVTEMGTDVKDMMCSASVRDDFRFLLRTEVQKILDSVNKQNPKDNHKK